MRLSCALLALTAGSLLSPHVTDAGRWNGGGCGGWGARSPYDQCFDPETVVTIQGEVRSVETFRPRPGMTSGIRLTLFTGAPDLPDGEDNVLPVHVGPEWYLEDLGFPLEEGMFLGVRGSLVRWDDETVLMAMELVDDSERVLALRADSGFPAWSPRDP